MLVSSNRIFHIRNWFESFEVIKISREERRCILKIKYQADFWKHLDGLFSYIPTLYNFPVIPNNFEKALTFQWRLSGIIGVNKCNIVQWKGATSVCLWVKTLEKFLSSMELKWSFRSITTILIGQYRIMV